MNKKEEHPGKEWKKEYCYWLSTLNMTSRRIHDMLNVFRTPQRIYEATPQEIREEVGIQKRTEEMLERSKKKNWERDYEELGKKGICFFTPQDEEYPENLLELSDYPVGIFVIGSVPESPSMAIVGARDCSIYGKLMARQIGSELAYYEIPVISGMARGIDAEGQRGAMEAGGISFAVLGNGPDLCYPAENRRIYEKLKERGGILSEFPPGTAPAAWHFPVRNRLISVLSKGIVVVEAKKRSGSLITVDCGLEQGREIYAVPGRIGDERSLGCLELIKNGAGLFLNTTQMLSELSLIREQSVNKNKKNQIELAEKEEMVYDYLHLQEKSVQSIINDTGFDLKTVMEVLLSLELKGLIETTEPNLYRRAIRKKEE